MSPCWEVSPTQCVWEEKGDFNQWIRPEQIALGRASVLKKPWELVEPVASSNAILSSTPLQLPHVEIAFLLLGILVHLRASRNPDFYVKSLFENIWLNKNSGRKRKKERKKKALCRQNTSVRQMSRPEPQATSVWPLLCSVWLCLAPQPPFRLHFLLLTAFSPQWLPFTL